MRSRITIEVDFQHGNKPVIQILAKDSDDVRDGLVHVFLESLGHVSRWCTITYQGEWLNHGEQTNVKKWLITPMELFEIPHEMKLMEALLKERDDRLKIEAASIS